MRLSVAAALGICAWGQSGLEHPTLGVMLDAAGAIRPVHGIAGSVTLGEPLATGVLSSACSRQLCLSKTDSAILFGDRVTNAPSGPALFALDGGAAFVYFPQSKQLARWTHTTPSGHGSETEPRPEGADAPYLDFVNFDTPGEILSLRVVKDALEAAVRREDGIWILRGNAVIDALPDAPGPVMLLADGALFATADAVVLRRPDRVEVRFDLAGAEKFIALNDGYVQIRAGLVTYALRVEAGRERLFVLPEPPP